MKRFYMYSDDAAHCMVITTCAA